jgi:hypothetical protein
MAKTNNSRNAGMKPGQTNAGSFKKGDLRQWKGGQRNKAAVAITRSFRNILVLIGGESLVSELNGKPISKQKIEWLGQKLWAMALSGDMVAVKELLDRMEGKVTQPVGIGNTPEEDGKAGVLRVQFIMPRPGEKPDKK